jgi:hypothetical protein
MEQDADANIVELILPHGSLLKELNLLVLMLTVRCKILVYIICLASTRQAFKREGHTAAVLR